MKDMLIVNPPRMAPFLPDLGIACAARWLSNQKINFDFFDWNMDLFEKESGRLTRDGILRFLFSNKSYGQLPSLDYKHIVAHAIYSRQTQFLERIQWEHAAPASLLPAIVKMLNMPTSYAIKDYSVPDYTIFDYRKYYCTNSLPYFVSEGCAWNKCAFCCRQTHNIYPYQAKREDQIRREMLQIKRENPYCTHFWFYDEFIPMPIMHRIADVILSEPELSDLKWTCYIRVSKMTKQEVQKFVQAGLIQCCIGVENSNQHILNLLNKHDQTADTALQLIEVLLAHGILPVAFLMTHIPTETQEDLIRDKEYAAYLRKLGCVVRQYDFVISSNTDISKNPEKYGINRQELNNALAHKERPFFSTQYFTNGFPINQMEDSRRVKVHFPNWNSEDRDFIHL